MARVVRALDRKLLRDLWHLKGQAIAIAAVIGAGLAMFVAYLSTFASLERSQARYYERYRFADVFAQLKRAPLSLGADIAAIPGVLAVETRVVADVTLDVPGLDEPALGRLVSIPVPDRPMLNGLFLRSGRLPEPGRPDEVVASELFTSANQLTPGHTVSAVINGRRRALRIVGIALSPEYVITIRPGEVMPDDRRFGVLWMDRRALATAFDMEGGFNDVALKLAPDAQAAAVIEALDRRLEPYGGFGAIPRAQQISHWTISNELSQLRGLGLAIPVVFLGVAAFLLNIGPHPHRVGAARADRGPQGPRLRQPRGGLALRQVEPGDRGCGQRHRPGRGRLDGFGHDRPLQRLNFKLPGARVPAGCAGGRHRGRGEPGGRADGRARRGASSGAAAPGRGDAPGGARTLSAQHPRARSASAGCSGRRAGWWSATSSGSRFGR